MAGVGDGKPIKTRSQRKTSTKPIHDEQIQIEVEDIAPLSVELMLKDDQFKSLLQTSIMAAIDEKLASMQAKIDTQDSKILDLELDLDEQTKENDELRKQVESLIQTTTSADKKLNDLEQYTRRNSVRVFGIQEPKDHRENTDDIIVQLATEKLGITLDISEIDRSHRVGKKTNEPGKRPRPILVKLATYRTRQRLIRARRKLKATGITIKEDLTRTNQLLLEKASKHPKVESSWSTDGRIIIKLDDDGTQVIKQLNSVSDLDSL